MEILLSLLCLVLAAELMGRLTQVVVQLTPGRPGYMINVQRAPAGSPAGPEASPPRRAAALPRYLVWWRHRYAASCALVFVAVFILVPPGRLVSALIFSWFLVTLSWTDYYTLLLPDRLTLPFLLCAGADHLTHAGPEAVAPASCLLGALLGGGSLLLLNAIFRRVKGYAGLGGGDAKLLAGLGAWLGWEALPEICCGAALAGLACCMTHSTPGQPAKKAIAFGPCLALAGWLRYVIP